MMGHQISRAEVEHIAELARLNLDASMLERLQRDLSKILTYVDLLSAVDTRDVQPLAHPLPLCNVLREDRVRESFGPQEALGNAPAREGHFFAVPRVVRRDAAPQEDHKAPDTSAEHCR